MHSEIKIGELPYKIKRDIGSIPVHDQRGVFLLSHTVYIALPLLLAGFCKNLLFRQTIDEDLVFAAIIKAFIQECSHRVQVHVAGLSESPGPHL